MLKKILNGVILIVFFITQIAYSMGLSTTFGSVRVDNVKIGRAYSMENDAGAPLVIKNTSDYELTLKIDVIVPKEDELADGYEPIPDITWIHLDKSDFALLPQSEVSTDVVIDIPKDERYKGKKYQVYIWSHTIGGPIAVGLKSKLLISTVK